MNYFTQDFGKRFGILFIASIAVGLMLWGIDFTDWANDFTMDGRGHEGEGREEPGEGPIFDMIKPFIKLTVLMLIPAVAWVWISKLVNRFSK